MKNTEHTETRRDKRFDPMREKRMCAHTIFCLFRIFDMDLLEPEIGAVMHLFVYYLRYVWTIERVRPFAFILFEKGK